MKKNRVVALFLCAALLLSGFTNTMVKAAGATGKQTTTAQKSKWPSGPSKSSLSSDSAIVMELSTGTILYRKNIQAALSCKYYKDHDSYADSGELFTG